MHIINSQELHIIEIMDRVYHQIEAEGVLYTASAVMIYKRKRLMIYQTSIRFGLDTKNLGKSEIFCLKLTK